MQSEPDSYESPMTSGEIERANEEYWATREARRAKRREERRRRHLCYIGTVSHLTTEADDAYERWVQESDPPL